MTKKTKLKLITLFGIIWIIKIFLTKYNYGPIILPDEGCIIETAKYFAKHFSIPLCSNLTTLPVGNPPPLITILFSPFYLIFSPYIAYKAILILHTLLISSLIFPLYHIGKLFIEKDSHLLAIIPAILFMPQIFGYESTIMSETLFSTTSVYALYFYHLNSSSKKNTHLISAFLLAFLAIFMRPFGVITITALAISEFINSTKKLKTLLYLTPPIIIGSLAFLTSRPDIYKKIIELTSYISTSSTNFYFFTNAIINQINSLIAASLVIPFIIYICLIYCLKNSLKTKKLITATTLIIILNTLIASVSLFMYYTENQAVGIGTRYINLALILTYTIGIFGLHQSAKINKRLFLTISALTLISLLNLSSHTFNLQATYEYLHLFIYNIDFFRTLIFIIAIGGIAIITILKKPHIVLIALLAVNLLNSTSYLVTAKIEKQRTIKHDTLYQDLEKDSKRVLFLTEYLKPTPPSFWTIKLLTNNTSDILLYQPTADGQLEFIQVEKEGKEITMDTSNYDYIVTNINLDLPLYKVYNEGFVYRVK